MRVKIRLFPREINGLTVIPLDFRRYFISLTKTLLQGSPCYQRFTEDAPGYSPYVFHVAFGEVVEADSIEQTMIVRPPISYIFSTGLPDLFTPVINTAINHKGAEMVLGLVLEEVELLPLRRLTKSHVHFHFPGHVVFRTRDGYPDGNDLTALEEAINYHGMKKAEFLAQHYGLESIPRERIRLLQGSDPKKGVCYHYGGTLTTVRGDIFLEGFPLTLQFLYDYGLGVRTGQGFGYVEVVQEW
ncbi:MAG: hypothetical protein HPY71_08085 [Firmicutes bacterium]|nr:hypothetical protein [Bacillota bacterium]